MSGWQDEASDDIESSGGNIKCPHCLETLEYSKQERNWLCERCGILWSNRRITQRIKKRQAEIEREMCEGIDELVKLRKRRTAWTTSWT